MNKKRLIALTTLLSVSALASCGGETPKQSDETKSQSEVSSVQKETTSKSNINDTSIPNGNDPAVLTQRKNDAISKLDRIVNPVLEKITDDELRTALLSFYNQEKAIIEAITDGEIALMYSMGQVTLDAKTFAIETLMPLAIRKLDAFFNPLIDRLPDDTLKASVQSFYNTEIAKIRAIQSLDEVANLYKSILEDVQAFIASETERILIILKDKAIQECEAYILALIEKIPHQALKTDLRNFYTTESSKIQNAQTIEALQLLVPAIKEDCMQFAISEMIRLSLAELDPYVNALIEKIPEDSIKENTRAMYVTEKNKLNNVTTIEGFATVIQEIKDDLIEFALNESKRFVKERLDELVEAGLAKIHNQSLKTELEEFYDQEILKVVGITSIDNIPSTLNTVIQETTDFISDLLKRTAKEYLRELLSYDLADPYEYVPESMKPSYSANLVSSPKVDFTSFVNVSQMDRQGFGPQWQMVVENLDQLIATTKAMNVVNASMTTISNAMNIYIENSSTEELNHTIENSQYKAELSFVGTTFYFEVVFKTSYNVPGIGSVTPTVKLALDITTAQKAIYIKLNDSNLLKYTMGEGVFELASTYGVTVGGVAGSRSAYFQTATDTNGNKSGHIYEYTTLQERDAIKACADFYVNDGYVTVIGNKASGMIGFDGVVSELYSESQGRLLGCKVQEQLTILGVTGTYHTLWFNLWDISGINSVKVGNKTNANKSSLSTCDVNINNSSTLFKPTYNKKLGVQTSRKYDIELRDKYYYSMTNGEVVCTSTKVPMMFIQDDNSVDSNYSDFSSNMLTDNGISSSVTLSSSALARIRSDYSNRVPVFQTNKNNITSETIQSYLNSFDY